MGSARASPGRVSTERQVKTLSQKLWHLLCNNAANAWAMDCSLNVHNLAHAKAQLAAKRRPSISIPEWPQNRLLDLFKTYLLLSCIHPHARRQTHKREDRQSSTSWIWKLKDAPAASKNNSAAGLLSRWKHDSNDHRAWTVWRLTSIPPQRRIQRVHALAAFRHGSSGNFDAFDLDSLTL